MNCLALHFFEAVNYHTKQTKKTKQSAFHTECQSLSFIGIHLKNFKYHNKIFQTANYFVKL